MESSLVKRTAVRKKRALRVRKRLQGTAQKPRLCVVKTNQHIYVQLIDDESARTLASVSTLSKQFRDGGKNKESGKQLGNAIAALAQQQEVTQVLFDRGSRKYHGVIAAVAEGAREQGLRF